VEYLACVSGFALVDGLPSYGSCPLPAPGYTAGPPPPFMHARLPHSLMVFALVCGASLVPRGAEAATPTCECTSAAAGPMTECDAIDGARCEAIEDCTSIVPLSRPAGVTALGGTPRYAIPVTAAQPSKGPANALVTMVVFSEFQCPFCSRMIPITEQMLREYPTQVRVVWRNLPLGFHPNAMPAAEAAMEAFAQGGNEKFWRCTTSCSRTSVSSPARTWTAGPAKSAWT
jgi:hypothetical protein